MKLYEFFNEGEVVPINKTEPKRVSYPPYFSPEEAQRAFDEWRDQAQVDQDDGVVIKDIDGKQYRIMTSYSNQAYDDGEVFLQGLTDPNYIELVNNKPYGHPDAAELLYYHSKDGTYVQENSAGSSITLYNVKGEKKVFTVDKVSPTGAMIVSGNGLNRIVVGNTPNAVTFNVRDPNYKIRASGFQMQGKAVRDISPADIDNAIMQIKNKIKTFPKNQLGYNDLLADYFALKFTAGFNTVNSMQHENFADGKKKGKSIDEGPKDFDNMNLDQKGKQDSIDYFYHTHAPTFGKPTKAGSFKGHNVVTFKTPDGTLMFLVNRNDQVVFYIGLTKMPDGVAVGNVRSNGTIKATEVYRYLVSKYGKLYSDKHQTPDGRKIWANLAKYNPELKISDIGDRLMATENFADGKKKGKSRPGRVKKAGASCNGSVTSLRKKAKDSSGEKAKMLHWCANMKSGRNKK